MATKNEYLARKLYDLLAKSGKTQVQLAEFCGVSQGLVSNHLTQNKDAYPKIELLIKYARFFGITLFELTGNPVFKGIEFEAATLQPTEAELDFLRRYHDLPDDHWLKRAISDILMGERKSLKEGQNEKDTDT